MILIRKSFRSLSFFIAAFLFFYPVLNSSANDFSDYYRLLAEKMNWTPYPELSYEGVLQTGHDRALDAGFSLSGFTRDEVVAVTAYTGGMAGVVNPKLYSGRKSDELEVSPYTQVLDKAIEKLPVFRGRVYRTANLPDSILAQHQIGNTVVYRGYTSTSKNPKWISPEMQNGHSPSIVIYINSKNGRSLSGLSYLPGEDEVLFKRGSTFKVESRAVELLPGFPEETTVIHLSEE